MLFSSELSELFAMNYNKMSDNQPLTKLAQYFNPDQILIGGLVGVGVGSSSPPRTLIISSFESANSSKILFVMSKFRVFIVFFLIVNISG